MFSRKRFLFLFLFCVSLIPLHAQSDYGFYTKYGIGGIDANWRATKIVLNEFAGLRPGSVVNTKQTETMMGWNAAVGFTFDVGLGLWTEGNYATHRCIVNYVRLTPGSDSVFHTYSYINRTFSGIVGANIYNDGMIRVALFTGPGLNVLKMQSVPGYMDPFNGTMFFRAASMGQTGRRKIGTKIHGSLTLGANVQIGDGWGLVIGAYCNIGLGNVNLRSFRDKMNPDTQPMFPEENYTSRLSCAGFTFCVFFGE